MSEGRPPSENASKPEYQQIALFINKILLPSYLHDLIYPPGVQTTEDRYAYGVTALTDYAVGCISSALGRNLEPKEVEFIRDRVEAFIQSNRDGE